MSNEKMTTGARSEHHDTIIDQTNMSEKAMSELKIEEAFFDPVSEEYRATEKRLVRKLDLTLVPMLWVLYLFNYLDRNNIAQARLNTFEKDPGLKGNQFNIAVSILNVGYMLMQLPRYAYALIVSVHTTKCSPATCSLHVFDRPCILPSGPQFGPAYRPRLLHAKILVN